MSPYPSKTVTPAPAKKRPSLRSIAEPPDMACRTRPPRAPRTFPYTVFSKNWCCTRSAADGPGPRPNAFCSSASAYATATSTALSKGPAFPSASARRRAAWKTFSKTYGTARTKLGRKAARSGSSSAAAITGWCPSFTPPRTAATSTIRPKTCASGRNSSVEAGSPGRERKTGSQRPVTMSVSNIRWEWVITQPLGRPVVPDV